MEAGARRQGKWMGEIANQAAIFFTGLVLGGLCTGALWLITEIYAPNDEDEDESGE
jgi:hypothetical protein